MLGDSPSRTAGAGWIAVGLAVLFSLSLGGCGRASDSHALWRVVHDLCVPDMRVNHAPAPCTAVDLADGYAVLKDIRGKTQLLLVPTARVRGIEDPALLRVDAPNYWADAWTARALFFRRIGRTAPRTDLALAVNSIYGRSQDQLHIHIDCVRRDVRDAVAAHIEEIGPRWRDFPEPLAGRTYRAIRIEGEALGDSNPFRLLADGDPDARADMGRRTLILVGAAHPDGRPAFVLLANAADWLTLDTGHGEVLLDHRCEVLADPAG